MQAGNASGNDIADLCSRDPKLIAEAEGPLEKVFSRVVPTIRNRPAMLFIDPYGRSRLSFSSLKRLLRRKQTFTELIIKFDAEAIWRQAIQLCADQCGHSIRCRAMFHKIGKVLGIDQLTEVPAAGPAAALIRNYVSEIARYGFFVGIHKITDEFDLPMSYHLIYCTRTREHIMLMNNLVRTAEDHIFTEYIKEKGIEPSPVSLERDVDLRCVELKYLVREYLTKWGSRSVNAAKWQIVFDRFGDFHEDDFIHALNLAHTKHLVG
jgi:hypothetical protein